MLGIVVLGSSCVCVDCYRPSQTMQLRLDTPSPADYTLTSSQAKVRTDPENHRFLIDLPNIRYGYMLALLVVPIGNNAPETNEEVLVLRDNETVRKISIAKIRRLPTDPDGTHVLKIK